MPPAPHRPGDHLPVTILHGGHVALVHLLQQAAEAPQEEEGGEDPSEDERGYPRGGQETHGDLKHLTSSAFTLFTMFTQPVYNIEYSYGCEFSPQQITSVHSSPKYFCVYTVHMFTEHVL